MITNFKVAERLCKRHALPESFICLAKNCCSHSLLCSACVKKEHPHLSSVHAVGNFVKYFSEFVESARERFQRDRCEVGIAGVVRAKKQEMEQLHLELIERIMRKLSEEKKAVCQSLDQMQRQFREKEALLARNQQQRQQIINYLLPLAQSSHLLQLKLTIASGRALNRLKEHLSDLQTLTNSFDKNCFRALETAANSEATQKLEGTLFRSLAQLVREQSILVKPPLPDKVYHFSARKGVGVKVRPSSSCDQKSGSGQGSTKARSVRQF